MNDTTKFNVEKPEQYVVCAACKTIDNIIFCGARHWDEVMRSQAEAAGHMKHAPNAEEGFIDQFGEFLTRDRAMNIVKKNGQKFNIKRNGGDVHLFSEGLY